MGDIIERWAVIKSASKYNDGTYGNEIITLGSDQLSIIIPLDDEAKKLKKSMGKKFFIDNNTDDPTAYELTGTGNVPDTYNGHGITSWIVKECAYSASEDDLKYGVCNYKDPTTIPPSPQNPDESVFLSAKIIGKDTIRYGMERTYSVEFTDNENIEDVNFKWNIVSDFCIERSDETKNPVKLYIEDDSAINKPFLLQVIVNDSVVAELEITVTDLL